MRIQRIQNWGGNTVNPVYLKPVSPPARPGEGPGVRGRSPREENFGDFALKMATSKRQVEAGPDRY